MRNISLIICCAAAMFTVLGCQQSSSEPGAPVATTEDEFAAYDAMIAEDQAQTEADAEPAAEDTGQ